MGHRHQNRKALSPGDRYRDLAGIWRRVNADPTLRSLDDIAAALSTSTERVVEALGPDICRMRTVLKQRRPAPPSYEVVTRGEARQPQHIWQVYRELGRQRRQAREQQGHVPGQCEVVVREDFDAFLREVVV